MASRIVTRTKIAALLALVAVVGLLFARPAPNARATGGVSTTTYNFFSSLGSYTAATAGPNNTIWAPDGFNSIFELSVADPSNPTVVHQFTLTNCPAGTGCGTTGITMDAAGNIWFTETDGERIGKIDPTTNALTEYPLPAGWDPEPRQITTGPDGSGGQALWFTFGDAGQDTVTCGSGENCYVGLAEMDTNGVLVQLVLVQYLSNSWSVASGPGPGSSKSLWFTVNGQFQYGVARYDPPSTLPSTTCRLTASAAVPCAMYTAAYGLPASMTSQLQSITTGSDGAVWFIDNGATGTDGKQGAALGRIDQATGTVSQYGPTLAAPAPGCVLQSGSGNLVTGPDGNLWVTNRSSDSSGNYPQVSEFSPTTHTGACYSQNLTDPSVYPPSPIAVVSGPPGSDLVWMTTTYGLVKITLPATDTTPPVVAVSFTPNGANGWFNTSPASGSVTASDSESGGTSITAITCTGATVGTLTSLGPTSASAPLSVSAQGSTSVACTATDGAGNAGAAAGSTNTATVRLDSVAPSVSISGFTPNGSNGWFRSGPASGTVTASDATSGVTSISCTDDLGGLSVSGSGNSRGLSVSGDGVHHLSCTAVDVAGNTSTPATATVQIDATPPSVSCGAADGLWHATDVTIACTASDATSGLANAADATFNLSTSVPAGTEIATAATGSHQVCDLAGNCATAGPIGGNMVDKKPPAIAVTSPTSSQYLLNQTVNAAYTCSDGGSGVAACTGAVADGSAIDTGSVGSKSFSVQATDKVGNASSQRVSYTVASEVSGVRALAMPPLAGFAHALYGVLFTTSTAHGTIGVGGTISLTAPVGTVWPSAASAYRVIALSPSGQVNQASVSAVSLSGAQVTVTLGSATIAAGDRVIVLVFGVQNPPAGSYTLQVATSGDAYAANSAPYQIVTSPFAATTRASAANQPGAPRGCTSVVQRLLGASLPAPSRMATLRVC